MSKIKIYNGVTINMSTSDVIETGKVEYVGSSKVSYCGGAGDISSRLEGLISKAEQDSQAQATAQTGMSNLGGMGNYSPQPAVEPPGTGGFIQGPQPMPAYPPNIAPPAPGMGNSIGAVRPGTYGPGSFKDVPLGNNSDKVHHMGPGSMGPGSMVPERGFTDNQNMLPPPIHTSPGGRGPSFFNPSIAPPAPVANGGGK